MTAAQLASSGVSRAMISTQVAGDALLRLRQGVYLARSAWPDEPSAQHLVRAHAELAANPEAALSHGTATIAWRLPSPRGWWHDLPVSVTLPAGRGFRYAHGTAVHHVAELPPEHLATDSAGCRVTSLERTAVDLSAGLELPDALVILDAASRLLCAGFVAEPRRSDFTNPRRADAARQRITDVAHARRRASLTSAIRLASPARESAAESLSAGHFELAGLPRPECQSPLRTSLGVFFPDFWWRAEGVIGECDGALTAIAEF